MQLRTSKRKGHEMESIALERSSLGRCNRQASRKTKIFSYKMIFGPQKMLDGQTITLVSKKC
jgi:hypothetical protein